MSDKFDFARHISDKISLLQQQQANEKESNRVAALDAAHLSNPDEPDFCAAVERRIANALLEYQMESTARLEERIISKDLERNQ